MTLAECHAVSLWHTCHRGHPLEKAAWDVVLTLWLMGWVGVPTALLLDAGWGQALAVAALFLPGAYVACRARLHRRRRLRCDWICALRPER
ncbi:MAG TPA: hypothetical protein VFZ93_12420 [Albitalea sp.]